MWHGNTIYAVLGKALQAVWVPRASLARLLNVAKFTFPCHHHDSTGLRQSTYIIRALCSGAYSAAVHHLISTLLHHGKVVGQLT